MISLITPVKVQKKLAEQARIRRLKMNLTQEGLSQRSGVALATLRKFERTGFVSLESFLKIHMVIGGLESILQATQISKHDFSSIDEVIDAGTKTERQRGTQK